MPKKHKFVTAGVDSVTSMPSAMIFPRTQLLLVHEAIRMVGSLDMEKALI